MQRPKTIWVLTLICLLAAGEGWAQAQEPPPASEDVRLSSAFELEPPPELLQGEAYPTTSEVIALEQEAMALVRTGNCEHAVDKLGVLARSSAILAGLVARGLEPFYDARNVQRENYRSVKLRELASLEGTVNLYRRRSAQALITQAECYVQLGEKTRAISSLWEALDRISLNEGALWERARRNLYDLIGLDLPAPG